MKDNILIISDVHHKTHIVDQIVQLEVGNFSEILCSNDVFDHFNDTLEDTIKTAKWFVSKINDPIWVFLRSNHSVSYEFAHNTNNYCSGFTPEKSSLINGIVKRTDWCKQKTFYFKNNFLFTHAGLSKNFLDMMVKKGYVENFEYTIDNIVKYLNMWEINAIKYCEDGGMHPIFAAGVDRGGNQSYGSPIWIDFSSLTNIKNINQICFHTPHDLPIIKYVRSDGRNIDQNIGNRILEKTKINFSNGITYDLDTCMSHYAILSNTSLDIYEICFETPKNKTEKGKHIVVGKKLIYNQSYSN